VTETTEFRPWLKNYPHGVPANVNPEEFPSLMDMLKESFVKFADSPAYSCMGKSMTYGQIDQYSNQFGAYLLSRGLEAGDKIALMMPNVLQYPIALFGALKAGLIVVNTNPLYKPRELEHQLHDSGAKAIVILENYASILEQVMAHTQVKTVIVTSVGELLSFPKGMVVNFVVRKLKRMVPKYSIRNTASFKDALTQGKKFEIPPRQGKPDDTIVLQYTGGTTGVAKGAMLTNRNLVANMMQFTAWAGPFLKEKEEVALCPLPIYHIFAFTINMMLMRIGAHSILVTNARDTNSVIEAMKSAPISIITGLNSLFVNMLNHPEFSKLDFSKLKVTGAGGMAMQRPVIEQWKQVTGCTIAEGYGMTESSPVISSNPFDGRIEIGSIGMPVPSTDIRIVDEQGNIVGFNQVGEIQAKGPQMMKGYYNRPDETAKTMTPDGWLCTGDIGMLMENGFLKIVDRKKEMILVSGFNVFPNEVEEVLVSHPKVLEAAAIGVEDEKAGEVVKVFIVKKDDSLTKDELIAFAKENMTGYKVPKHVEFRKELPKTNVGKILRRVLREEENSK
jgi:long-chain acyl-CoA synthetase